MTMTHVSFSWVLVLAIALANAQSANAANATLERREAFLRAVEQDMAGHSASLFTVHGALRVKGVHGDYEVETRGLGPKDCMSDTLANVTVLLKKDPRSTEVETPKIYRIYYDNCVADIAPGDEGDIYVPTTAGNVWIKFQLDNSLKKTKWQAKGEDCIIITASSPTPPPPPLTKRSLPWGGKVQRSDKTISFTMASSSKPKYYTYALHFDLSGHDISIDPQIINTPPH